MSSFLYIIAWVRNAYASSAVSRLLQGISARFRNLLSGSAAWDFIRKESLVTRAWEHSGTFRLTSWLLNFPSRILGVFYTKCREAFAESITVKFLTAVVDSLHILLGVFLALMVLIPHARWHNIYSVLAIVLLAVLYFLGTIIGRKTGFNLRAIDAVLFIFVICVILAEITSVLPGGSISTFIFYMTCFLLVLLMASLLTTRESLASVIELFLIGISASAVYGIWQAVVVGIPADPSLTDVALNEGLPGRLYSTMGNPNNYAEILVLTIPFFFAVIFNADSYVKKSAYFILALPSVAALLLTYSRSGWIAFAVSLFVYVFLKNRKMIPFVLLFGVLCIPLLPDTVYRRLMTIWNPQDSSAKYRVMILETIKPMFRDFWATGIGLGPAPFMRIYGRYYQFTKTTAPHSHNLFLQIWLETGIAGILSFVWFTGRLLKSGIKSIFNKSDLHVSNILMAAAASLCGVLVMGLAEHIWFYPRVMLVFWADVGIMLAGLGIINRVRGESYEAGYSCANEIDR